MTNREGLDSDRLYRADFVEGPLPNAIADLYAELVEASGTQQVLVLKRFGSGTSEIRDTLREHTPSVELPRVEPLVRYAHTAIDVPPDAPRRLSSYERSFLFDRFLEDWEWSNPYLQTASQHDSFTNDVEQFSVVAAWQGTPVTDDSVLKELTEAHTAFQESLTANDYLEHAGVIHAALDAVADPEIQRSMQDGLAAVIVLEAEEYTAAERAFVKAVTTDVPTHWVVSTQSDIQRVRNETGNIKPSDLGDDVSAVELSTTDSGTLIDAVATYLARNRELELTESNDHVAVLNAETFEHQLEAVANEIERLRTETDLRYDEVAIVVKDRRSPIRDIIDTLNSYGIPSASTTVSGLGDDPAVRELYTVIQALASPDNVGSDDHKLLATRVGIDPPLEGLASSDSVVEGLWEWIRRTDLKQRVATAEAEIEARAQFSHIDDVVELAAFVEHSPLLDGDWEQLQTFLEFAFEHAAPDAYGDEIDSTEGGVLVDAVQQVKTGQWDTVFVLNVVDQEYPSDPQGNRLFPQAHMNRLPEYPMVSAPTVDEVTDTFETATQIDTAPVRAYYTHYSRRLLGVAARAASNRLYFTTYREQRADPGKYRRPSRFLVELSETFPQITEFQTEGVHTESRAVAHTLDSIDRTLDQIRRAPTTDDLLDVGEIERNFGAIQQLLAESDRGDELADALSARAEFAEGVVRRE